MDLRGPPSQFSVLKADPKRLKVHYEGLRVPKLGSDSSSDDDDSGGNVKLFTRSDASWAKWTSKIDSGDVDVEDGQAGLVEVRRPPPPAAKKPAAESPGPFPALAPRVAAAAEPGAKAVRGPRIDEEAIDLLLSNLIGGSPARPSTPPASKASPRTPPPQAPSPAAAPVMRLAMPALSMGNSMTIDLGSKSLGAAAKRPAMVATSVRASPSRPASRVVVPSSSSSSSSSPDAKKKSHSGSSSASDNDSSGPRGRDAWLAQRKAFIEQKRIEYEKRTSPAQPKREQPINGLLGGRGEQATAAVPPKGAKSGRTSLSDAGVVVCRATDGGAVAVRCLLAEFTVESCPVDGLATESVIGLGDIALAVRPQQPSSTLRRADLPSSASLLHVPAPAWESAPSLEGLTAVVTLVRPADGPALRALRESAAWCGVRVLRVRHLPTLSRKQASEVVGAEVGSPEYTQRLAMLREGPVVAIAVIGTPSACAQLAASAHDGKSVVLSPSAEAAQRQALLLF